MTKPRLRKGDISIQTILELSEYLYKKEVDNKRYRAKVDIKSAKIQARKNLIYNRQQGMWEQIGREVKFTFLIRTTPISYKDTSGIKIHTYPVTFLIRDFDQGLNSAFRWRTGSLRKPKFSKKKISEGKNDTEKDRIRKTNKKIQQDNIRNGIQMQFFFHLSFALQSWGLLWGVNYAAYPPRKTNPKLHPYFDKHAYWIVKNVLTTLLTTKKGIVQEKLFKPEKKIDITTPQPLENIKSSTNIEVAPEDDFGLF